MPPLSARPPPGFAEFDSWTGTSSDISSARNAKATFLPGDWLGIAASVSGTIYNAHEEGFGRCAAAGRKRPACPTVARRNALSSCGVACANRMSSQAGLRACERAAAHPAGSPSRALRRSGHEIRLCLLTVAGAAPELPRLSIVPGSRKNASDPGSISRRGRTGFPFHLA